MVRNMRKTNVNHVISKDAFDDAQRFDIKAVALCGKVWRPKGLDDRLPVCLVCHDRSLELALGSW